MKTFRMFGMALVAAVIAFAMSSCEKDNKDDYKDYPQLIMGKWFNFTPEASGFIDFQADGTYKEVGPDFITFLRHHIAHNDNQRVT